MSSPVFFSITNDPRDYAWGMPGGISRALGAPPTTRPEAELWLGAHQSSPSRIDDAPWRDLAEWERASDTSLPYLLKVLAAAAPLSLQAHPDSDAARAGFDDEESRGIARDAFERNFKDPFAKPELIVAVDDGFEALCGFRPRAESLAEIEVLAGIAERPKVFAPLVDALSADDGLRDATRWLLSGGDAVSALLVEIVAAAQREPERFELVLRLAAEYDGDPGIAVALLLNHTSLRAGECLWLPAGNIHAYLRGLGVELMGPSDNVMRGGLTGKHVDVPELLRVLDFTEGPPPFLAPERIGEHVAVYRPASVESGRDVDFELLLIDGDADLTTAGAAIGIVLDGDFVATRGDERHSIDHGAAVFIPEGGNLTIRGAGRLFLASPTE